MRYGLIRFGSRTDVVLPAGLRSARLEGRARETASRPRWSSREAVQAGREEPEGASE